MEYELRSLFAEYLSILDNGENNRDEQFETDRGFAAKVLREFSLWIRRKEGISQVLGLCPDMKVEEAGEYFSSLDFLAENMKLNKDLPKIYSDFEETTPELRGGEQKAVFGCWLAFGGL